MVNIKGYFKRENNECIGTGTRTKLYKIKVVIFYLVYMVLWRVFRNKIRHCDVIMTYYQHFVVVSVWIHLNFQVNWSFRRHVILFPIHAENPPLLLNFSYVGKHVGKAQPAILVPRPRLLWERPNGSQNGKCPVCYRFCCMKQTFKSPISQLISARDFWEKSGDLRSSSGDREKSQKTGRDGRSESLTDMVSLRAWNLSE